MLQIHERYHLTIAELRSVPTDGKPHYGISFAVDRMIRAVRSPERITEEQRDELGGVLDEITFNSDNLLVGDIDRRRFEDGMGALVSLAWLWAEAPEHRRGSDTIADNYAHARMLQNWAHSVCLAREILARGERRQRAFADRYLASQDIFATAGER